MQQHSETFITGTEYEEKFRSQAEHDRLLSNLAALRQTLWEMRANLCQLKSALEESRALRVEAGCLGEQIDSMADRLRLEWVKKETEFHWQ